jgi:AcrR family transcriptional regulator
VGIRQSGLKKDAAGGKSDTGARLRFAFEDPLSSLPVTARKLLVAAKEIVADEGFKALTLKAVSDRAGENKAMVSYYFENKAGLIAAVLDSVIHDEYLVSLDSMKHVEPGQRTRRLVEEMMRMDNAAEDFQVFFELLPHVLRDGMLRCRLALLYQWYWSLKLEWLGADDGAAALSDPDLLGLAQLMSAVIDGLAIQAAIDPQLDLAQPYRALTRLLENSLTGSLEDWARDGSAQRE